MDIRVEPVEPSLTAVVVVEPVDLSRFMACYDAVYTFLRSDTDVRQTGQNVALYQHGQRMEVGVEVDRTFPSAGLVVSSQLPGGRIAHATHTTGYGDRHRTHDAVRRWCDEHGHDTAGIQWEIYSDPTNMTTSTSRSVTCSPEATSGDIRAAPSCDAAARVSAPIASSRPRPADPPIPGTSRASRSALVLPSRDGNGARVGGPARQAHCTALVAMQQDLAYVEAPRCL